VVQIIEVTGFGVRSAVLRRARARPRHHRRDRGAVL